MSCRCILHPTIRGGLRHYHFLTRLAREHEITLIVLKSNDIPVEVIDEMLQYTSHLVRVGEPPPPRPARRGIAGGDGCPLGGGCARHACIGAD
jgi:hypothetical protein